MNSADNLENWQPIPPEDIEEAKIASDTIDCPFYSVVPTPSSEENQPQVQQFPQVNQIYRLPPASSTPTNPEPQADLQSELNSSPEVISTQADSAINAEKILDSELDKVSLLDLDAATLDSEDWQPTVNITNETIDNNVNSNITNNINNNNHVTNNHHPSTFPPQQQPENPEELETPEIDREFQQLLQLNQELRTANDDLYAQVEGLTEALKDSQTELQRHKKRADVTESLLAQQNQELTAAQSQIESLFQQLETLQQNSQRQEALLDTYRAHLETNQHKLAQIERECANLQSTYSEQSQQLVQSEAACRELRTRLMRQQRQTLQFKAALEKCLESPLPNSDRACEYNQGISDFHATPSHSYEVRSSLSKNQRIQPWSSDTDDSEHIPFSFLQKPSTPVSGWEVPTSSIDEVDLLETNKNIKNVENDLENDLENPAATENIHNTAINSSQSNITPPPSIETDTPSQPDTEEEHSSTLINPPILDSLSTANESLSSLEAQIDSVIQKFFAPPSTTNQDTHRDTHQDTHQENLPTENTSENPSSPAEFSTPSPWDNSYHSPNIDTITVDINGNITDGIEYINRNQTPPSPQQQQQPAQQPTANNLELEDFWGDISNLTPEQISILNSPAISDIDDSNSPSPVVYPNRPPKGRKSLSSVELPNFRPPQK